MAQVVAVVSVLFIVVATVGHVLSTEFEPEGHVHKSEKVGNLSYNTSVTNSTQPESDPNWIHVVFNVVEYVCIGERLRDYFYVLYSTVQQCVYSSIQ